MVHSEYPIYFTADLPGAIAGQDEDSSLSPGGKYVYMQDLHTLEKRVPHRRGALPESACKVLTPLKVTSWADALKDYPDQELAEYLLRGIVQGFHIGFDYNRHCCEKAKSNMMSAVRNAEVVEDYLQTEVTLGRVVGPFPLDLLPAQVSHFGVIPKGHQTGRWRLILDLSHPEGRSVNDGIEPELCSLSYSSVDEAVRLIQEKGTGARVAKLDLESAYRMIPVHPDDRLLLRMEWKGQLFIDTALPFGLRSAPKVFTAVADALMWIFRKYGVCAGIHYLDDYLFVGAPDSNECQQAIALALKICEWLGVHVSMHKLEGPSTLIVFLGILLDTEKGELRLPPEKLARLRELITQWQGKKSCTKREILSLIGHLQHACKVVKPGRTFLRRIINLSMVAKQPYHHIRINREFTSDLQWWAQFLAKWNGTSMMSSVLRLPPSAW